MRIAVFAKEPVPGRVKTRLLSRLTPEDAAEVYRASMRDVVERAESVGAVTIHFAGGASAQSYFADSFPDLPLRPQVDGDLGERMAMAVADAFAEGEDRLVILGTDSPTLPRRLLDQALEACLETDVVFGPAEDGGYYLVGISAEAWPAAAALFRDIPWSTPSVLDDSLRAADEAELRVTLLDAWYDIDTPDELRRAAADVEPDSCLGRLLERRPDLITGEDG